MKRLFKSLIAILATASVSVNSFAKTNVDNVTIERTITMNINDIKVVFELDSLGRAISKTTFTYNNGCRTPRSCYTVDFGDTVNTMSYAAWDSNDNSFTKNKQTLSLNAQIYPAPIILP